MSAGVVLSYWENDYFGEEEELEGTLDLIEPQAQPEFQTDDQRQLFESLKSKPKIWNVVKNFPFAKEPMDLKEGARIPPVHFHWSKNMPESIIAPRVKYPADESREIDRRMEELIAAGIYEEADVPFASNWLRVPKPGKNEKRDVIDARGPNQYALLSGYPVVSVEDILLSVSFLLWSALDWRLAFWQIFIDVASRKFCAVRSPTHLAVPTRLPMGHPDSSTQLQRIMDAYIIRPFWDAFGHLKKRIGLFIYRDNLFIGSNTEEDHLVALKFIGETCRNLNLKFNFACQFLVPRVDILGVRVNPHSLTPIEKNLNKIGDLSLPTSLKKVRQFLGMCNFYRQFVRGFAALVKPFELLLTKDYTDGWPIPQSRMVELQMQFDAIKQALQHRAVLGKYQKGVPVELYVDASGEAAGVIMVQNGVIVRHFSKAFNRTQRLYGTTHREALAILWAVSAWRHLLPSDRRTVIFTDHKPLETFLTRGGAKDVLLLRWSLLLQAVPLEIRWIQGKANLVADALTRTLAVRTIQATANEDVILKVLNGELTLDQVDDANIRRQLRRFRKVDDLILYQGVPYCKPQDRVDLIMNQHTLLGHMKAIPLADIIKNDFSWPKLEQDVAEVIRTCPGCQHGLQRTEVPQDMPWFTNFTNLALFDVIQMDLMTELPETPRYHKHLLVIVEKLSGFPCAYPLRRKEADEVLSAVWNYFCQFTLPRRVETDRGGEFLSKTGKEFFKLLGVEHRPSSSHNPQAQGAVERMNGTVVIHLENAVRDSPSDWDLAVDGVLLGIRVQKLRRTGFSPYELVYGKPPTLPLALKWKAENGQPIPAHLDPGVIERAVVNASNVRMDQWAVMKAKLAQHSQTQLERNHPYRINEEVMIRNHDRKKFEARWLGPFRVIRLHAKGVVVKRENSAEVPYVFPDIKRWRQVPNPEPTTGEELMTPPPVGEFGAPGVPEEHHVPGGDEGASE
eukprot:TRINITY_DN17221_c0_g1_i1.p1 TRINITY_DN17221_c0_g1~~TRINITY_DN17221_c0_g1_i1.p1  ORF type:complete len:961 (+),score=190.21 TRINITY_DN17221_c0_g1_i1:262-3144(+)